MARSIQPSHLKNPGVKAFFSPLIAAAFWVFIAFRFPAERIPDWLPQLAPYAEWVVPGAMLLFLALALWAFLRAARVLVRISNSRHAQAPHGGGLPGSRQGGMKQGPGAPRATPTVQRMR